MLNNNQQCNIKKSIGLILLVVLLCFYLAACGQASNSNTSIPQDDKQDNAGTIISDDSADESNNERDTSQYGEAIDDEETIFKDAEDNYTLVINDGKTVLTSEEGDFSSIYAYGDGFYALFYRKMGFYEEDNTTFLTVISNDGTELVRMDNPEYSGMTYKLNGEYFNPVLYGHYCGQGVFAFQKIDASKIDMDYFNCYTRELISIPSSIDTGLGIVESDKDLAVMPNVEERILHFSDNPFDYILTPEHEIAIYSDRLELLTILNFEPLAYNEGKEIAIGDYSDGGFIYYSHNQLQFYDCENRMSTEICKDSDKIFIKEAYKFKYLNGEAEIILHGADGKTYYAKVDKHGIYLEEPHL